MARKSELQTYEAVVLWFNEQKGYGFLQCPGYSQGDLFVHYSEIQAAATYRTLAKGDIVRCSIGYGKTNKLQAENVVKVEV